MDTTKTSKSRRPLPTPTSTPTPATPVAPSNVYSSHPTQNPPPLPTRPKNVGSGHTVYLPPPTPPPNHNTETPPFREPELVTEELISSDEPVPELIPQYQESWYNNQWSDTTPWHPSGQPTSWDSKGKDWDSNEDSKWSGNLDNMDYWASSYTTKAVRIDGRDQEEEKNWWNPAVREKSQRPGLGILSPTLAEMLHNSDHSLFSVSVTPPDIKFPDLPPTPTPLTNRELDVPSSSTSASQQSRSPPPPPPTPDDVRTAVPHPHAYYCGKENGWVLLLWKSSSIFPPLAKSFRKSMHQPFPDQNRRRQTTSCIGEDEQPFGPANKTHHFHIYRKAIDAHTLNPPFYRNEWEKVERVKQLRRTKTIRIEEVNLEMLQSDSDNKMEEDQVEEDEGDLLDLYVCCQCSFYCAASGVIPGVIPRRCFDEFIRDRRDHPAVGKSREVAVCYAVETVIR
jgi:ubiquitin carboxyl-terminal hydrolase 25